MKVYIAGRYDRRNEFLQYASYLVEDGHTVTSRWINGHHDMDVDGDPEDFAYEDWEDLDEADCVISFTETSSVGYNRGGRHVEFGIGLAEDKLLAIVGPKENVFHHIPYIFNCETFEEVRQWARDL